MVLPGLRVRLPRRDATGPKRACGLTAVGASLHVLAMAKAAPPDPPPPRHRARLRDPRPPPGAARNGACSSAGEHYVDIVGVTGSIPVTPTISFNRKIHENSRIWHILASCLCISILPKIIKMSADRRHNADMKRLVQAGEYPPIYFETGCRCAQN